MKKLINNVMAQANRGIAMVTAYEVRRALESGNKSAAVASLRKDKGIPRVIKSLIEQIENA